VAGSVVLYVNIFYIFSKIKINNLNY
jgi:hypothetical protein